MSGGYVGKMLRVDLTNEKITEEKVDEDTLRMFVGGTGLGIKIMYDEVPAGVEWSDPENRMIWSAGPLAGTRAPASGTYAVCTKGPLTNLFVASHANGFFAARMKFAGFDGVIVQGEAKKWVYLYLHDGKAELRDASHLVGKDTWETEDALQQEIGDHHLSVSCIGPAGENLVRFACIGNDHGHMASTNGCGAVMGSKKLKAIAAHGQSGKVPIYDKEKFNQFVKDWWEDAKTSMWGFLIPAMGTNGQISSIHELGTLPINNYTELTFPAHEKFNATEMRPYFEGKPKPCYACRWAHCQTFTLKTGPHKGELVEESEYEGTAAFSSVIGITDLDACEYMNNLNDRLGMDAKEMAFTLGLAFECYEKGLITKKDTDGLDLTWGNADAAEALIRNIAARKGFGKVLAEGVYRASQKIGGDAPKFAVYTHKGNAPHVHDDRGQWSIPFSMAVSDMGSIPVGDMGDVGDLMDESGADALDPAQAFDADKVAIGQAINSRRGHFIDCLGVCAFPAGVQFTIIADTLSAATGWSFTWQDCATTGERVINMMRAFNLRHGLTREDNSVSPRILEAPTAGPAQGKTLAPVWDHMLDMYYKTLNWDAQGKPLPETLKRLGLENVYKDLVAQKIL